ncbi:MAG TPA: TetR/AcrR family transcriptional regulator [Verrucomicrobiae bacterium]|nr:TetR/AcrR family transcriptional regulator [Verrucomicrobiae bacterium]
MGRTSNAREKLLQVAFDLIWQHSYGSVSVDDICERAQVRKGSFYHFFPSKSDLAVAAYEEHWQASRAKYDRIFSPLVAPLERIANYCNGIYENQRQIQQQTGRVLGCPFASVGCELSTQDEKIRRKAGEMFERMCQYLETTLRDAHEKGMIGRQDFSASARTVFSLVTGMLLQAKVKNDADVLRGLGDVVLQLIGVRQALRSADVQAVAKPVIQNSTTQPERAARKTPRRTAPLVRGLTEASPGV